MRLEKDASVDKMSEDYWRDAMKNVFEMTLGNPFVYLSAATGFAIGMAVFPYRQAVCDYISNLFNHINS